MKSCEYCGSELPVNAQFCGNCGHMLPDSYATVTDFDNPLETATPVRQTPPLFSNPLNPNIRDSGMEWQGPDSTLQTIWPVEDIERVNPQFTDRKTDENEAVLPDLLMPGMLAIQRQMPSPAQAPMVQGTPQVGGVPSVQGTPAVPGNVPQSIPGPHQGAASSAPSNAPQEAQFIPAHHQPVQHPRYQPSPHHYQPVHHPQPAPPPHDLGHHHHTGSLHEHKTHSSKLHHHAAVTSKAGMGVVSKWLIVTMAALVIIGSSSIFLAHALVPTTPPPVLTITGSNVVQGGGVLHVHGQGFQPGDGVTLTIDNGLPVSLAGQHRTQAVSQGTERNAQVTGLSLMNIAGALEPHSAGKNITVSSTGTFDASVTVPSDMPAGKHTLHAKDNQSSLSASLQFTIPSPQLVVSPTSLNFGSVEVGRTVNLSVTVSNQGGASLHWSATVEGSNTNWLTLTNSSGVLGTNGLGESIIVTANTNNLSVGPHTATLRFHSDNGDVQTTVKINVIPIAQSGQQAILNVSQQSLDFGQLQAGQQAQQSFSIANLGNLPLQWQAGSDASSATWLSLATTKGTVQTGAAPQAVQVNVNSTGLAAGSYSGTITVTSNGGNTQVDVTLVVTTSTQTTTPPPAWTVSPTKLDVTNCSGSSTWTCNVTVTEDAHSQVGITWSPGSDQSKVTFNPTGGTLSPGKSVQVTISSIPCNNANFTFTGSGGAQSLTALWNCSPTIVAPPTPKITVAPQNIDPTSSNCSQNGDGTYTCNVTVGESSPGNLNWFAPTAIGGTGISFKPSNGQLTTSQTQQPVVISFIPCSNTSFTFTDQNNNTATVIWSCKPTQPPPTLTVNPTGLSASSSSRCTSATTASVWSCTVTVMETSNSQGNLTWSVKSSLTGVSFKPSGSTLSPGQSVQVTISNIPCVGSATFTFSGGVNPVPVSWGCG
jgi:hypothetical protein